MTFERSIDKFKEIFFVPVILLHFILLVNTKFTLWPEMVVYPYLVNKGYLLYSEIINPYPPAFTAFLAMFAKVFGYLPAPYQLLTWAIVAITDISIFTVASKLSKSYYHALFALIFFPTLSITFGIN